MRLPQCDYHVVQDRGPKVEMGHVGPFKTQEGAEVAAEALNRVGGLSRAEIEYVCWRATARS